MTDWRALFERVDARLCAWMARYGVLLLRLSLGIIFLWFGVLKFFPELSAAESLATRTIGVLSFGLVPPEVSRPALAVWESAIGLGLVLGVYMRLTLFLLWLQMLGTVTPLFLFPGDAFSHFPLVPSLEGQYIIKNLVLISAGIVIGSAVCAEEPRAEPA